MKQKGFFKNKFLIIIFLVIVSAFTALIIFFYEQKKSEQLVSDNSNSRPEESSSSMRVQLEILKHCKNKYEELTEKSNTDPYSLEGTECISGNNPFSFENIYYCYYKDASDGTGILTKISKTEWIDDCIDWQRKELNQ